MNTRKFVVALTLVTTLFAVVTPASAADTEIQLLREQLLSLSARLDELEKANRELREANTGLQASGQQTAAAIVQVSEKTDAIASLVSEGSGNASWADKVRLKGDFRMRYENIDEQDRSERNRNRVRARAAIVARVSNDLEVGIGLASGSDDPVSTNQTLGGGGSSKGMNLDLAYFKWTGLENTSIVGGKFKNILYKPGKNSLLWDGDWNPEGMGIAWASGDYFANAIGTWLESDSNKETEFSYGLQIGFRKDISYTVELAAGVGYYRLGTKGKGSFFGGDDVFFGNSFNPTTNTYLYDYEELELFADLGFELAGRPASLFFDYVQNQDAGALDTGYAVGFTYGSAKAEGTAEFAVIYKDLEADSTFGLLTDSDFAGGGTDGSGYILKGGYAIAKNWNANLTYTISETDEDAGNVHDYDRLQLDLAMKF